MRCFVVCSLHNRSSLESFVHRLMLEDAVDRAVSGVDATEKLAQVSLLYAQVPIFHESFGIASKACGGVTKEILRCALILRALVNITENASSGQRDGWKYERPSLHACV